MWRVCRSSASSVRLRVSPRTTTRLGMMLLARPPSMRPTFAVVAAEDTGAVGADHVAVDDGTNVVGGRHGVHVAAQQERRDVGRGPRKMGDEVAGVAADLVAGVVDLHAGAHALEDGREPLGHVALALGDAT